LILLPFITPPAAATKRRVGNERCGILELEVRGGLTVGESATIAELLAGEQSSFVRGAQIADAIAKEESLSLTEAFQIIESALSGQSLEPAAEAVRVKHADRIDEVGRVFALSSRRDREATVTALIRSRCDQPAWTLEDTQKLDQVLFDEIWLLAQEEQDAEDLPSTPASEADLKKPPQEDTTGKKRPGARFSGN
jgi:hypothetical protein